MSRDNRKKILYTYGLVSLHDINVVPVYLLTYSAVSEDRLREALNQKSHENVRPFQEIRSVRSCLLHIYRSHLQAVLMWLNGFCSTLFNLVHVVLLLIFALTE